ncbi:hypothetical protein HanHA300_Chr11g0403191 [Helianthus annuus]|nr:hypothetical protein HanHA300_Chr11g0403191 [Helianthus annuus]KAJ0517557.1 hypothetical protein HanHA89_Chr11g0426701 [Helianthus annuus]KAJ0685567.1 hypothetical protein HanLR1_Chr11g0404141 [Helianthus annuus]
MFSKGLASKVMCDVLSACYPKLSKFCLIYEFVSCIEYQTQHLCIFKTKIVDSLFSATVGTHIRVLGIQYVFNVLKI